MLAVRRALWLLVAGSWLGGCAAGTTGDTGTGGSAGAAPTTQTTPTDTNTGGSAGGTTTSSGSTTTGEGGTITTTGEGGTTTTTGEGGTTTTPTTGSGSGPMPATETALLLATGNGTVLGAAYHPDDEWTPASPGAGSSHTAAVALLDAQTGVGIYRQPADGTISFVKWSTGTFSPPLAIGGLATTVTAPSMARWAGGAAATYIGPDFKHYFAHYKGPMAGWSPSAEPILANGIHSFGPSPASIAIVKGDVVVAYAGSNGNLYDQARVAGAWQGANGHGVDGTLDLTPTLVEIPGGPAEAMIAYVRASDKQVLYTVRSGGVWTPPAPVPDAFSNDPVALTSAFGTGAVLAFRGLNQMLYTCVFTPASNPPWSQPQSFGVSTPSPPALAPGIGGKDAEMVFVTAAQAHHARLAGTVWSAATPIAGANVDRVALATFSP